MKSACLDYILNPSNEKSYPNNKINVYKSCLMPRAYKDLDAMTNISQIYI